MVTEQPELSFAGLLRQLRTEAKLTQEELAAAAGVSPRSVSNLERGINRTAHKDTALLLAGALRLTEPADDLFVAAARGNVSPAQVLAAVDGAASRPGAVTVSPYRGLRVFGEQDAGWFFGREAAAGAVLERLSRLLTRVGVLVVSGSSGAGKSSLLRAGVLPRIREKGLAAAPEASSWPCVLFTPTRAPLDELALRVAPLAGADAAAVRRGLASDPDGFALTARQAALGQELDGEPSAASHRRLLLVVDQFEELFTQCPDEGQRRALVAALHAAATAGQGVDQMPAALVVLGVRADFEARCADYPQLAGPVQDRYLVTAMTEQQLRMAITEPAKKAGSTVDGDLTDRLLADVRNGRPGTFGAGVLPLLSHALDQAWQLRTAQAVRLADYERTGGIEGAVAASAQRAYDGLTPAQQVAARHVFTRLAATSNDGVDGADRVTRAELTEGKSPAEAQDVEAVLEAFAVERLLTLAAETVELSHEAVLTAWPLLRDTWLADTRADQIERTRLHTTAAEWARHGRDPSYLYSGSVLEAATSTATRIGADPARHPPLGQTDRDFLQASDHAHRRTVRRRQTVIAGLLALTLIAIAAAGIAVRNAASTGRQHAIGLSRQLAAESLNIDGTYPVTARRLAVAARAVAPTGLAASAMTTLLAEQQQQSMLPAGAPLQVGAGQNGGVFAVAFSPDGKLASAQSDGTVRLWDTATGRPVGVPVQTGSGPATGVHGVAFSPDGRLLASADGDGTVRLWHAATGRPAGAPLHASTRNGVLGVAFSPDGKLLASADGDGTVRLWDTATGRPAGAPMHASAKDGVRGVAFSPDGRLLASADGDGTVRLWHPATRRLAAAPIHASTYAGVYGVAFSPDGRLLASADGDATVGLWHATTGRPSGAPLQTGSFITGGVYGVAFSPDGKRLASADSDGTVRLWYPAAGRGGARLQATSTLDGVQGVAFSPAGNLLASAGGDGTVRLWDPARREPRGAAFQAGSGGPDPGVYALAFIPDRKPLATSAADGTLRFWDPASGRPDGAPLHTQSGMAVAPDGTLATSGHRMVRFRDPVSGRQVRAPLHVRGQGGAPDVAFSADGRRLATIGGGTVRLWNPTTGRPVGAPVRTNDLAVGLSPDGKLLATGGFDGMVHLWDPATGRHVGAPLQTGSGFALGVMALAFSPDGKLLVSGNGDGTIWMWNPATGRPVNGSPIRATSSPRFGATALAFSPDGRLLASADTNEGVRVWNPATGHPVGAPVQSTSQSGVVAVAFSPDGKMLASASADGLVRRWQTWLVRHPYRTLCSFVGAPTAQEWNKYASGDPQPKACG